ncbi:hypothetical protein RZS08_07680, partial [Arthrospira platensis SPKY1]|nr:hypothetical protein [Arthrospira platensis SPKY1]
SNNIESRKYWITIHFTNTAIFIKTKLAIYNSEHNQTLELIEVTPFAKLQGVQNLEYPENKEHQNHKLFVSEIYLVHHTQMCYVLMSRKQTLPNIYGKFELDAMNQFEIYHKVGEFEYYYTES